MLSAHNCIALPYMKSKSSCNVSQEKKSKPKFARNHSQKRGSRRCFVRWELEFARRTRLLYHQVNLLVLLLLAILDCTKTWDHPSNLFWACGSVFSRPFLTSLATLNDARRLDALTVLALDRQESSSLKWWSFPISRWSAIVSEDCVTKRARKYTTTTRSK